MSKVVEQHLPRDGVDEEVVHGEEHPLPRVGQAREDSCDGDRPFCDVYRSLELLALELQLIRPV
jgi:hypothetical protein